MTDKEFKDFDLEQSSNRLDAIFERYGLSVEQSAEELFYRCFKNYPYLGPWRFDYVQYNLKTFNRKYDLVLANDKVVVLASIKHKLRDKNIKRLVTKDIPAFRKEFPRFSNHKLYGAVGAMVIKEDKENLAKKNGFYVLVQSGERVEVIAPKKGQLKVY